MTNSPELIVHAALTLGEIVDARKWGAKFNVFAHLAKRQMLAGGDEWVEVSYRHVANAIGRNERYVDTLLKALVSERVLDHRPGAGRRPHAYRINPNPTQWRNVQLRVPLEVACWRLDAVGLGRASHLVRIGFPVPRASSGGQRATESFAQGQMQEMRELLASIVIAAEQGRPLPTIRDFLGADDLDFAAAPPGERGTSGGVVTRHVEAQDTPDQPVPALISVDRFALSSEPQRERDAAQWSALMTAVGRATGGGALWGRPAERLEALVGQVDEPEQLVAWCEEERARHRDQPMKALALLAILEARAAGGSDADVQAAPAALIKNLRVNVLTQLEHDDVDQARSWLEDLRQADPDAAEQLEAEHPELHDDVLATD